MTTRDLDQGGFGFQRVRTYLGPSLGWIDELVQSSTEITVGGTYVVKPGDNLLLVDVAATVTIQLPDVIKWVQQTAGMPSTGFERSLTIKDIGGNAANFNIVVAPFGQQALDNIAQSIVISTSRAAIKLIPLIDLSGWAVALASIAGGGGGGGGDVFKAGNNTFTGTNIFQGVTTAVTMSLDASGLDVATTAFVKGQNYITGAALLPYALIASPIFTGNPQAPTPAPGDNDQSIATTAFVQNAIGGAGAPVGAEYITSSANATLTAERVLTNTASITWDFTTPGQAKANSAAGGGNVSNTGTPTVGQYAKWTNATTIQGISAGSVLADIGGQPVGSYQPLDGDLTAISALAGTNTIYYRSAPDIWSPVTFSGLAFSGGVLTVTGSGGNVISSGVPTVGQVAVWTDATHIQGLAPSALGLPKFTYAAVAPTGANPGDFWYDSTTGVLSIFINDGNTTQWIQVSPTGGTSIASGPAPQCGRLVLASATQLKFAPFNGDQIKINGVLYSIPTAGIAGLNNTSAFLNGVAGQNLAVTTTYYIYAFNNAGVITADFSPTGHATSATSGNIGVETKSGDDTRTLIGMCRTNASAQFQDAPAFRWVISWFNRRNIYLTGALSAVATGSTASVELDPSMRTNFLTWGDEACHFSLGGVGNASASLILNYSVYVDGVTPITPAQFAVNPGASQWILVPSAGSFSTSEGYHFLLFACSVSAGVFTFSNEGMAGMIRG